MDGYPRIDLVRPDRLDAQPRFLDPLVVDMFGGTELATQRRPGLIELPSSTRVQTAVHPNIGVPRRWNRLGLREERGLVAELPVAAWSTREGLL